ncbi:hypothetical protein ACFOZY_10195 [Chungangia koreensis]|uniref:Elongation factor Tu n=1 Tax=Chungangia koreensis TaxID=752657 RepID=A0ABV8X716_9LACT
MRKILAFETKEEFALHEELISRLSDRLTEYQQLLIENYALTELPKGVIWTSEELATSVFSEIPIPAYTNENFIYITPDLEAWKRIFSKQLDGKDLPEIDKFYEKNLESELLVILAHELTHHSDWFIDEFGDERNNSIWFEEGMCFYLPRKLLLNESEFDEITQVETALVQEFYDQYGNHSLDDFGSESYFGSLSSIMFDYWRSYLKVKELVEDWANHDINKVFAEYHKWNREGRKLPLTEYFRLKQSNN